MKHLILLILLFGHLLTTAQAPLTMQEAAVGLLELNQEKIISLAREFPEAQYDWRPQDGVRSVSEVLMHMAATNYFILMNSGAKPPAGIDAMTLERSVKDKEEVIKAVEASFEYAINAIGSMSDKELDDEVQFPFPGEYNKRSALLILTDHSAEHMGQLIAYARMNGIKPPWSN